MGEHEVMLRRRLAELHQRYLDEAAPIIAELARIESLKPPAPIFIKASEIDPSLLDKIIAK